MSDTSTSSESASSDYLGGFGDRHPRMLKQLMNGIAPDGAIPQRPAVAKWPYVVPILTAWVVMAFLFFGVLAHPYPGQTWQQSLTSLRVVGVSLLVLLVLVSLSFWWNYRRHVTRGTVVYDYVQAQGGTCWCNTTTGDAIGVTPNELVVPPVFGSQPQVVPLPQIQRVTVSTLSTRATGSGGAKHLTEVRSSDGRTLRFFANMAQLAGLVPKLKQVRPEIVFDGLALPSVELVARSLNTTG